MAAAKDFDDVLALVGGFGRFQKLLLLSFFPYMLSYTSIYFGQIFFALTPDHWCRIPTLTPLSVQQRINLSIPLESTEGTPQRSKCSMYDVDYEQVLQEGLTPNESWPITSCKWGWDYDFNSTYPTIVSELDWVCENSWRPNLAQSIFFGGSVVGSIILGILGDRAGRLPAAAAANLIGAIAGLVTAFAPPSFTSFLVLRFAMGLSYDNCFMMTYILMLEFVSPEKRSLIGNLPFAVFLTLGLVFLPWIAYVIWDWRYFTAVISIPMILCVIVPFFIPESARWLVSRGKIDRADKILRKVAAINGKVVDEQAFAGLSVLAESAQQEETASPLHLFRTPALRNRVILMLILWMVITVVYDGHVRNVENIPLDIFLSFTITGALEAPACLLPAFILDKLGRRITCSVALAVSGLAYLFIIPLNADAQLIIILLAMLGRLFVVVALNSSLQFFVELLPTKLRGQGTNLVHVAGHVATFASPLIVYLAKVNFVLPFLILGVLGVAGGLLVLVLPETARQKLPETADEAEQFRGAGRCWFVPCIHGNAITDVTTELGELEHGPAMAYQQNGSYGTQGLSNPSFIEKE